MTLATNLISGASHTNAKTQSAALRAPYLMLLLALAGIADASYVAHASLTGQPLREFFIEGANTVLNSPYARIAACRCRISAWSSILTCLRFVRFSPLTHGPAAFALARCSTPRSAWHCRSISCTCR